MQVSVSSTALTSIPFIAWHNLVADPLFPSRYVWSCGGKRFDNSGYSVRGDCYKIDLSTNTIVDQFCLPWWYAHSPMVRVGDQYLIPGGMGEVGSTFSALELLQVVDLVAKSASYVSAFPGGAYDLQAAALSSSRMIFQGGHGWQGDGFSLPRWDLGIADVVSGHATVTSFSAQRADARVYSPIIPTGDGLHAVTAGGFDYNMDKSDGITKSRNLDTIETLGADGFVTTWQQRLSVARRYGSMQPFATKNVLAGGTADPTQGYPQACGAVDILDPATMSVAAMPDLLRSRYHAQSAVCTLPDGSEWLALWGGLSVSGVAVTDVEMRNLQDGTSLIVGSTPAFFDHDRISVAAGNTLVSFGGCDPSGNGTNNLIVLTFPAGTVCTRV